MTQGIASVKIRKSNIFYSSRHDKLSNILKENLAEKEGEVLRQEELLTLLQLEDTSTNKRVATKLVTDNFPGAFFNRRKVVYHNIHRISSLQQANGNVQLSVSTEVNSLKEKIKLSGQMIDNWRKDIETLYSQTDIDIPHLKVKLQMYNNEVEKFTELHEELDELYEAEIKTLLLRTESNALPQSVQDKLNDEFDFFSKKVNFGLHNPEEQVGLKFTDENFEKLRTDFKTECPVLWNIMKTLFPVDEAGHTKKKELSYAHAISLLMSLRNRNLKNDVKLCFSLLLQSFGVGCRLMNFLAKMSMTYTWQTLGSYLDSFIENKYKSVCLKAGHQVPIILLMDNINVYRGNKKYHRLFRTFGQKMWNFTGRGILIPNLTGIEELFTEKVTATESQRDILGMDHEDIYIENNTKHLNIWNEWKKHYLLQGLHHYLNRFPKAMNIQTLTEKDFNDWLKRFDPEKNYENYRLTLTNAADVMKISTSHHEKSDVSVLELSLENNSTVAGSGAIIHEFQNAFGMPHSNIQKYLPYDVSSKTFSLKQARSHFEYIRMLHDHQSDMTDYEQQLSNAEKQLETGEIGRSNSRERGEQSLVADAAHSGDNIMEGIEPFDDDTFFEDIDQHIGEDGCLEETEGDNDESGEAVPSSTLAAQAKIFKKEDKLFFSTYNKLQSKMWKHHDQGELDLFSQYLQERLSFLSETKDHLGRSLLHLATEQDNFVFARCLLSAGFNPNTTENCGAAPLTIAVIQEKAKLCELLVKCGADVRGPVHAGIRSPLEISEKLELAKIYEILNPDVSDFEDDELRSYDQIYASNNIERHQNVNDSDVPARNTPGFITGIVGDAGTCRINRSVMEKSSAYSWIGVIPGDLHTKGAIIEACFKELAVGGFHHVVKDVFKRPKLKTEIFKEKKFEEDNYRKIRDALRDCAMSYCIAAAYEFKKSQHFPDVLALKACYREDGNHNKVIIESFLKWIEIKCDEDPVFKYHSRLFLHYGPLMELFDFSTHFNFGLGRETVFIVQLPTFAQLGFRNYYSEVFIHVINLIAKWPIAFRKLLEQNCSVNLSGKCGKGIELDCWVESRIVKPTKKFLSGHTTVKTCTRLGGSVDMVNMIKEAYRGRSAFDDHTTTRHSVPSALPD